MRPPESTSRDEENKSPERRVNALPIPESAKEDSDAPQAAITLSPLTEPSRDPSRLSALEQAASNAQDAMQTSAIEPATLQKISGEPPAIRHGATDPASTQPAHAAQTAVEHPLSANDLAEELDFSALEEIPPLVDRAPAQAPPPKSPVSATSLNTMLQVYMSTGRWQEAKRTLESLALQERDPTQKSGYLFSAAVITRDEIGRPDLALAYFDAALDEDPSQLKAFAAIDKILTKRKNWALLERSYRKMLFRLPDDEQEQSALRIQLWSNLGEIYRTRIADYEKASVAYENALRLDPQNKQLSIILAELQTKLVAKVSSKEVQMHLDQIAKRPAATNSYRLLYNYYRHHQHQDRAVAMASVLTGIRRADPSEAQFYEAHRPVSFLDPQRRPTQAEFNNAIRHPDQDPTLTGIFMLAAPAVGSLFARNRNEIPELQGAFPTQDHHHHGHLMSAIEYAEAVLGVPSPRLYVSPARLGGAQVLALREGLTTVPIVVAHQDIIETSHEPSLAFAMVQSLAQLSAANFAFLATGRSLKGMRELFLACLSVSGQYQGPTSDVAQRLTRRLHERVQPAQLDQLRSLTTQFVQAKQDGPVDLKQWIAASQMTVNRWAYLMSGDLPSALTLLAGAPERGYCPVSRKQMMQDLVLYSISEHCREVRQAIGLI